MDQEMKETMNVVLVSLNTINERLGKMDERLDKMDNRFDKMDDRFDQLEDIVKRMGLKIENVIEKKTQALFDAYSVAQSHFIDERRIEKLEETVKLHEITICNHSRRLNQAHIM